MWLMTLPLPDFQIPPHQFQIAMRRRLNLSILGNEDKCKGRFCRKTLDPMGDHLASCMRSGLIQKRAKPWEFVWQRIFREAGARVKPQKTISRIDSSPSTRDLRVDFIAHNFPIFHGVPIYGDPVLCNALNANGQAHPNTFKTNGAALDEAIQTKTSTYYHLRNNNRLKLLPLPAEIYGRWPDECIKLLHTLAKTKLQYTRELWKNQSLTDISVGSGICPALYNDAMRWFTTPGTTMPSQFPAQCQMCSLF